MKSHFLYVVIPYLAVTSLFAGFVFRYVWVHKRIESIAPDLPAMRASLAFKMWYLSLGLLMLGHAIGLLFPHQILLWDNSPLRLYLLEGFAFVVGLYFLLGWGYLLRKYFLRNSGPVATEISDAAFFSLLSVGLVSGLLTAALHRWSSSWASVTVAPYIASLVRGKPAMTLVSGMPFLVQLHLVSAFIAIAIFPFTRPALLLLALFHKLVGFVLVPVNAATGWASNTLESWARRYNPAPWIWPEEED